MQRRNFAETTIRFYVHGVEHFSQYFHRSPDQLGPEHIRKCQATLAHKHLHPHMLRHCVATPLSEAGADLRTIQILLGRRDLEETTIYLHLSSKHLSATVSPLDALTVSRPGKPTLRS